MNNSFCEIILSLLELTGEKKGTIVSAKNSLKKVS